MPARIRLPLTLVAAVLLGACDEPAVFGPAKPLAKSLPAVAFQINDLSTRNSWTK